MVSQLACPLVIFNEMKSWCSYLWPLMIDLSLSLLSIIMQHDVDAGVLKKVILADGAVVTIKGARSVSLRNPVELPLPLNRTGNSFASGLIALAGRLRHHASRSQETPLLSLRIVGPTSLTSPTSSKPSINNRLKLKRLAPGLVELSSASKLKPVDALSPIDLQGEEATALLTPDRLTTLWPVTSINGSNQNLIGFESLLSSVLGSKANEKGTFKLLKADVSARTFVKIGFALERKLNEDDFKGFPAWRTKPEYVKMHFEVLAKVEGDKFVPEKVMRVHPVIVEDTVAPNVFLGNISMSKIPIFHPPPSLFTL